MPRPRRPRLGFSEEGVAMMPFRDHAKQPCSLEKSRLAWPPCIWLGVDDQRMRLTQDQVTRLLPLLEHFAITGELKQQT